MCLSVFPTAQIADIIISEGNEEMLFSNPLEYVFQYQKKPAEMHIYGTNCYRGYQAIFQIKENKLYLIKVLVLNVASNKYDIEYPLNYLFPDQDGHIFCEWFSGVLRIPKVEELRYYHFGYAQIYE